MSKYNKALFKRVFNVYVCLKTLCLSWKLPQTYIHTHSKTGLCCYENPPEAPSKRVCMFQNPQPVMENETYTLKHARSELIEKRPKARLKRLLSMYVCLKTLCLSWKMKHTRSNMNLRAQLKLQKIKENATPIEESSCQSIEDQRKRYPYRGIDVCIFVYV